MHRCAGGTRLPCAGWGQVGGDHGEHPPSLRTVESYKYGSTLDVPVEVICICSGWNREPNEYLPHTKQAEQRESRCCDRPRYPAWLLPLKVNYEKHSLTLFKSSSNPSSLEASTSTTPSLFSPHATNFMLVKNIITVY